MSIRTSRPTRLLLARHGQTEANRKQWFSGSIEVSLTALGQAQARALAHRLRNEQINVLYSSPQQRALETAAPAASLLGLPVHRCEGLREMNFGHWEMHTRAELALRYPEEMRHWDNGSWKFQPQGGESHQQVIARAVPCMLDILQRHVGQTVLIIAHRTVLRLLVTNMLDMSLSHARRMGLAPASLSELRVLDDDVELIFYNDTSHLLEVEVEQVDNEGGSHVIS